MNIGDIFEIILYVEDMQSQVEFYRDTLGFEVSYPPSVTKFREESWVAMDTGPCTLALHAGGKRRLGEDAPKFVFRVEEVNAIREELLQKGVPLGEIRSPAPGVSVCDGSDPEGNKFSIESQE